MQILIPEDLFNPIVCIMRLDDTIRFPCPLCGTPITIRQIRRDHPFGRDYIEVHDAPRQKICEFSRRGVNLHYELLQTRLI